MVRTPNLLVIFVVGKDILLMCVGASLQISMLDLKIWLIVISTKNKVIGNMNVEKWPWMHQDFKNIAKIVRNMDIESLNIDPSPCGHQTSQKRKEAMENYIIGITTQEKIVISVKNM